MKKTKQTQITLFENALQERFRNVSCKEINRDFRDVEQKRQGWLLSAILFGIKTMYAKTQISHGKLDDFLAKAILADKKSIKTARRYIYLAGKVVEQIAHPAINTEIGIRVTEYFSKNKVKLEALFSSQEKLNDILKFILEGLSMHGLTKALQDVDAILSIEEKIANAGNREIPEEKKAAVQLSFEEELFAPIGEIQKLIATDSFADLPKEKALQFADALIAEGQALKRKLTK